MEPVPNPITIRDVARVACVGVGTVSRVLNGGRQVSESTRERVKAAISRLGFRPHAQARRMSRRTEMVCFLMSNREFLHSFHARILKGVETCARSLGQQVVFAVIHYGEKTPPGQIVLPPILKERGWVDGLVLAGTIYPNFVEHIQSIHVPYVMFGNNLFGPKHMLKYDQVSFDGEKAEFEATQFVIEQGHHEIAFVGETSFPWFRERHAGYRRAMKSAGLNPVLLNSQQGNGSSDYAEWAARNLLQMSPRPTAIMVGNDEIAFGLWRSFRKSGINVPDDISLVGFDDRDIALLMDPPLTTVRVQKEEIGETLMKMLLDKLHQPSKHLARQVIPTQLIIRGTVKHLYSNSPSASLLAPSANI
ncbi:MAG TPA: LacI family DNA-binding transcriptional regulator [Terriglobia bacterium]|nr:LacI family DNA-binding transcriptional regulator [Terriglobia bacterium]